MSTFRETIRARMAARGVSVTDAAWAIHKQWITSRSPKGTTIANAEQYLSHWFAEPQRKAQIPVTAIEALSEWLGLELAGKKPRQDA